MQYHTPADELAAIRAEIARLKLREAQLRARLIEAPPERRVGRWTRAEVVERRSRLFDLSRLPPQIHDNPAYWQDHVTLAVHCLPLQITTSRPGWPIIRDPRPSP